MPLINGLRTKLLVMQCWLFMAPFPVTLTIPRGKRALEFMLSTTVVLSKQNCWMVEEIIKGVCD